MLHLCFRVFSTILLFVSLVQSENRGQNRVSVYFGKMQAFLKTGKTTGLTRTPNQPSTSAAKERKVAPRPWVEKYRPRTVDDVVEQGEVVAVLKQSLESCELPNLLLYGPPGTGKTSTILAAARQLFGDLSKDRILELNASDERGIAVIRTKVKNFAQLTCSSVRPDGKPCPPFKIIILDEADSMTHAAQAALRRTMEKESATTRFCLVCNYVSRIIEPITSRCTKFRFKSLGHDKIVERLKFICREEGVKITDEALDVIIECSGGDLRRAITVLQSSHRLFGTTEEQISKDHVLEMSGIIPHHYLEDFLEICRSQDYAKLEKYVEDLSFDAYSVGQLLEQLNDFVVNHGRLTGKQKCIIAEKIGECSFRLLNGASEYLQIMDLGCTAIVAFQNNP
ncbi:replication factor C subunit 4 [Phlebotomus argentipes]|uniref:replication factor C subunit 4 n=1 Tax=Phlebotomus argentipes TaxID=94469 RepID=UPI0028934E86|nr:replication factor C subunit 4 [Phlebotomus argentipes]